MEEERVESWYAFDADEVARTLGASPEQGLPDNEATARLMQYGENSIREEKRRTPSPCSSTSSAIS